AVRVPDGAVVIRGDDDRPRKDDTGGNEQHRRQSQRELEEHGRLAFGGADLRDGGWAGRVFSDNGGPYGLDLRQRSDERSAFRLRSRLFDGVARVPVTGALLLRRRGLRDAIDKARSDVEEHRSTRRRYVGLLVGEEPH